MQRRAVWESAEPLSLMGPLRIRGLSGPRGPHPTPPPWPGAGPGRSPKLVKTLPCQRAARSQPLKGRQALYCSIITRGQMVFWESSPLPPPVAAPIHSKAEPSTNAEGWGARARFRGGRSVGTTGQHEPHAGGARGDPMPGSRGQPARGRALPGCLSTGRAGVGLLTRPQLGFL